jgi:ADP-heptose:LPS heptosyltransferase
VLDLQPEVTGARDMLDTAEIIEGLDLVISVDTSVAHLAGALGKPVWILLPAENTDWRWMRGRVDSPWYPSARLYRQTKSGDWSPVLAKVRDDLANYFA